MGKSAQRKRNEAEISRSGQAFDESRKKLQGFEFKDQYAGLEAQQAQAAQLGPSQGYQATQAQGTTLGPAQGYQAAQAQAAQAAKTQLGEDTGRTNQFDQLQVATGAAEFEAAQTDQALAQAQQSGAITGAGGATALAQAAAAAKQGVSANLQQQEAANAQARAAGATDVQREALAQRNTARQANIQQDQFNTGLQQQTNLANVQAAEPSCTVWSWSSESICIGGSASSESAFFS